MAESRRLLVAAMLTAAAARSGAQGLDSVQLASIAAGRQVVVAEKVAGSSWPRVIVYQFIAASPEQATAVFIDYERHASFLPNVKRSRVSLTLDSVTVEVDYILNVPIVADESYTVRDRLTSFALDSTG